MKCFKCQFENPVGAKFCAECANAMEFPCPQCGAKTLETGKFCTECAHPLRDRKEEAAVKELSFDEKIAKIQRYLPEGLTEKILSQKDRIEGERKQVTVMFCDMEGFTNLTERLGPEEAYSIMDQVYEILIHKVHDFEGTVNEMTGDGIVALFGAPIALEDAPQRAIRSAIAIHKEITRFNERMKGEEAGIPPLRMRVGAHTGDVVVGTLGNDLRVDFKAVGETVNLASRMEELAKPGTTYVTEATFRLTEGLFRFEALGTKDVKGKEDPVRIYQVISPSSRRTRFDVSAERGLTEFVGRERELELLLDGYERAKTGRGQAFSIVAEAGLGKSRLLYEFRKAVANEDITFLEGRCLSYSRGIAYHPVIDLLKASYNIGEDDAGAKIKEKVTKGLRVLGLDESSTLPYLLEILSVEDTGVDRINLSPETRKARILETLRKVVVKGSEFRRPLIMIFEDLHWADKSSEDVFRTLLEGIAGARVLLIFTYRPEFVHTWGGKSYHSQLNLVRLSNRESLSMLRCLLGTENIDKKLEELLLEKTEGIPFFIEELVKSLKELEIIQRRDDKYHLAKRIQEVTIPSTIHDVIMARVDSLPDGAKEVLQTGALIDREFTYEVIRQVTGLSEQELLTRLSSLKDAELLYERGIYPATTYTFKHALTQEVSHKGLLEKKRRETNERIANVIENLNQERLEEHCQILAYHYVRSNNKAKALAYLHMAHEKAARASAMEDAEEYFEQAMDLLDALPKNEENNELRISLLVNQWIVSEQFFQIKEYQSLLSQYEPLAVGVGNKSLLGRFYYSMGYCQLIFGSFEESIRTSTKAAELFEASGNTEEVAGAYSVLAYNYLGTADFARALAMKNEVPRHTGSGMDRHFNLAHYVRAACCASTTFSFLGRWDQAVGEGENALKVSEEFSDSGHSSFAASRIANAYTFKGDINQAIEYGELALRRATAPTFETWARSSLASAHCRAKQPEKGVDVLAELVAIYRSEGLAGYELLSGGHICDGYLLLEQYDKARTSAEGLLEVASQCKAKWHIGRALRFLGEVALQTASANTTPHFEKAISIFRDLNAENELALAYSGMGRYHKQQGNTEQAREYLTKALETFERLSTLIEPDKVRKELAELPQ